MSPLATYLLLGLACLVVWVGMVLVISAVCGIGHAVEHHNARMRGALECPECGEGFYPVPRRVS